MTAPIDVLAALPHRYPMLLVDRVAEVAPGRHIRALKAVTLNEPWYAASVPGSPADLAYPQVLLVESWGQAAGLLANVSFPTEPGQVMLFGSMSDVTFGRPVRPGDVIEHDARVLKSLGDTVVFEGSSRVGDDEVLGVGRMVMAMRPAAVLRPDALAGSETRS
ncbi:3-hydroxyacyl-ACP dehydratase FabZ family protein [Micromonospora sp. NPDC005220]|uniref:3-hydroxyacyl-ACP dehydratase FabZ family protein n=1 Tax=Micromonospora sp. NPDC005220 TaxID=3155589 RepID=UPI00339F2FCF